MATATISSDSKSAPASMQLSADWLMPTTVVATAHDPPNHSTLVVKRDEQCDLELRLLRALGELVSDALVGSYGTVKHSSRLTHIAAITTERLVTRTGIAAVVGGLVAQLQRVAQPWLSAADEAVGRCVIDLIVRVLLLADAQHSANAHAALDIEASGSQQVTTAGRLSLHERVQALLQGELPRIDALLQDAHRHELDALVEASASAARAQPPSLPLPVVMDLSDFVPLDDVQRMHDNHAAVLGEKSREIVALREQLRALEHSKQQLEQDLTDVHSYQESERGRRFQEMEEELARAKLEANQKAYNLRKLELVVEALRKRKRSKSSKSVKSEAGMSATTSDGTTSPRNSTSTA